MRWGLSFEVDTDEELGRALGAIKRLDGKVVLRNLGFNEVGVVAAPLSEIAGLLEPPRLPGYKPDGKRKTGKHASAVRRAGRLVIKRGVVTTRQVREICEGIGLRSAVSANSVMNELIGAGVAKRQSTGVYMAVVNGS